MRWVCGPASDVLETLLVGIPWNPRDAISMLPKITYKSACSFLLQMKTPRLRGAQALAQDHSWPGFVSGCLPGPALP